VDSEKWQLFDGKENINVRCIEFHNVGTSLVTQMPLALITPLSMPSFCYPFQDALVQTIFQNPDKHDTKGVGGALADPVHFDNGSLLTLDIMLSDEGTHTR
jgi:hypothetical protein